MDQSITLRFHVLIHLTKTQLQFKAKEKGLLTQGTIKDLALRIATHDAEEMQDIHKQIAYWQKAEGIGPRSI